MGAETIQKTRENAKSQMSRGNIFKYLGIITLVAVIGFSFAGCDDAFGDKDKDDDKNENRHPCPARAGARRV
jgi:hypothetical protein